MAFDDDMELVQEPKICYYVEVNIPGSTGNWSRSTSCHDDRSKAEEALDRARQQPHDIQPKYRIGAQVSLAYGQITGDILKYVPGPHELNAIWDGELMTKQYGVYRIPLTSEQVGTVWFEISPRMMDRLIEGIKEINEPMDATKGDDCND